MPNDWFSFDVMQPYELGEGEMLHVPSMKARVRMERKAKSIAVGRLNVQRKSGQRGVRFVNESHNVTLSLARMRELVRQGVLGPRSIGWDQAGERVRTFPINESVAVGDLTFGPDDRLEIYGDDPDLLRACVVRTSGEAVEIMFEVAEMWFRRGSLG